MAEMLDNLSTTPPIIQRGEIVLRPLRREDAEDLYGYLRQPQVTELTSYPAVSLSLAEAIIERSIRRWEAGEPAKWGLCLNGDERLIGTCGFNEWSAVHGWAELAYDLNPYHWGKGLMSHAVSEVVHWIFQNDFASRVQAYVRVDNHRSSRLLERGGFLREGCLRNFRLCRGKQFDFYVYGLLKADVSPLSKTGSLLDPNAIRTV